MDKLRAVYADKRVGERFEFGRYPQGENGEIQPITWRVLRREEDNLLVITEDGLDCKPYNDDLCAVTWEDCSLRRWLNDDFYGKAFNGQERGCVLQTGVSNNAGPETKDRVFLLSADEAESLFSDDGDRRALPTDFAVNNNAYAYNNRCWWWLRSRGSSCSEAACVGPGGSIFGGGSEVIYDDCAVRPAMRLSI